LGESQELLHHGIEAREIEPFLKYHRPAFTPISRDVTSAFSAVSVDIAHEVLGKGVVVPLCQIDSILAHY
jgi:hypothetical protein